MQNEPFSSLTHLIGFMLSITALVLLTIYAEGAKEIVGVIIFGTSMMLLYAASTIFHLLKKDTRLKEIFRRIDHSMIYVLIAGTYTPVCFIILKGIMGWVLFGIIWTLAVAGIIIKSGFKVKGHISTAGYVFMGWIGVIALHEIFMRTGIKGLFWLITGGILYTIGALIYYLDHRNPKMHLFGAHEIFHIFVIFGSFSHFWFILGVLT
ncbi:MAG: hemolysin III family protein [Candidatus Woesearchaeota archaeon]